MVTIHLYPYECKEKMEKEKKKEKINLMTVENEKREKRKKKKMQFYFLCCGTDRHSRCCGRGKIIAEEFIELFLFLFNISFL